MTIFAAKDIIAWTGKGINKLKNCESYELYGRIPVCKGMEKFSSILLEQPTETGRMFDNGLFLAFVFGFFSFLVTSIYTVFVEDSKSLKEISNKVIRTTDSIVTVLRTMWTLKVSKESNSTLEDELNEINKPRLPIPLVDLQVPIEKVKEEVIPKESKESEEIDFIEQIEFSLNDEWHPPKDDENQKYQVEKSLADEIEHGQQLLHKPQLQQQQQQQQQQQYQHRLKQQQQQHHHHTIQPQYRDHDKSTVRSNRRYSPKKSRSRHSDNNTDSNLHVLYEKKMTEPYSLHSRYDETASISHVENFRDSRWSINSNCSSRPPIKKFSSNNSTTVTCNKDQRRPPSPDFHPVGGVHRQPSRLSHLSYSSKKFRSNESSVNELPMVRGIFDQRRREKAKARRFNSTDRNSDNNSTVLNWEVRSMTVNIKPRRPPSRNAGGSIGRGEQPRIPMTEY